MSFQISLTPTRRAAGRFVGEVRDKLLKALADRKREVGLSQSDIAKKIGVHRSVVNRELRGRKDITLGRVAELATSMGLAIEFELVEPIFETSANVPSVRGVTKKVPTISKTHAVGDWSSATKKLAIEKKYELEEV